MQLGDGFYNGKTQAGGVFAAGWTSSQFLELSEQFSLVVLAESGTFIFNRKLNLISTGLKRNDDASLRRRILQRVVHVIVEALLQ